MPSAKRHPDGVVVEPPGAMPSAALRAEARGVVALREPLGEGAVRALVLALVKAFVHEDITTLQHLLTTDASYSSGARHASRDALVEEWKRKMQALEFSRLAGVEVVRPERIQRFEYDEVGGPSEPARPPEMRPGELFVRVPIETPRIGNDRFFGDVWVLVLRAEGTEYRVASFGEVDAN